MRLPLSEKSKPGRVALHKTLLFASGLGGCCWVPAHGCHRKALALRWQRSFRPVGDTVHGLFLGGLFLGGLMRALATR